MNEPAKPLRIFLSYAHADVVAVRKLHKYLREKDFDVWFDKENLVPGQDWQLEIEKGLNNSDVVIICLSPTAVSKEGFVQREFKFALDRMLDMPEGRIFLIPVRLQPCEVPTRLSRYHWVDLFEREGYARLMRGLKLRAEQLERAKVEETQPINIPDTDTNISGAISVRRDMSGNIIMGNNNVINMMPNSPAQEEAAQLDKQKDDERQAREKIEAEEKAKEHERTAAEEAENERLAKIKAENERLAREKLETERIAQEQVERERITAENAESERLAKVKAENERLAQEKAEQERLVVEEADSKRIADEKAAQEYAALLAAKKTARQKEQDRIREQTAADRLAKQKAEQDQQIKLARAKIWAKTKKPAFLFVGLLLLSLFVSLLFLSQIPAKPTPTLTLKVPTSLQSPTKNLPTATRIIKLTSTQVLLTKTSSPVSITKNPTIGFGSVKQSPIDGMTQIFIPATDNIPAFWIDQKPITQEMFKKFVDETNYQTEPEKTKIGYVWTVHPTTIKGLGSENELRLIANVNWMHPSDDNDNLVNLPYTLDSSVLQISWNDAQAYCNWAKGDLVSLKEKSVIDTFKFGDQVGFQGFADEWGFDKYKEVYRVVLNPIMVTYVYNYPAFRENRSADIIKFRCKAE